MKELQLTLLDIFLFFQWFGSLQVYWQSTFHGGVDRPPVEKSEELDELKISTNQYLEHSRLHGSWWMAE